MGFFNSILSKRGSGAADATAQISTATPIDTAPCAIHADFSVMLIDVMAQLEQCSAI